MQATVHSFDGPSGTGSVLCDDGRVLTFAAAAWSSSGLLHLRVGQRMCIRVAPTTDASAENETGEKNSTEVATLWMAGIGDGREIV